MKALVVVLGIMLALLPVVVVAQGDYGVRLPSRDGKWYLPVATLINGSDEEIHVGRGSVLAWDLVAPYGTPVYAMGPGVVEYAGCNNDGGYGCWLFINHGAFKAVYGHMVRGSIPVKNGDQADAQTVIGQVGMTGITSFGPHTHLEMHKPGGGRFRIDAWFDRSLLKFCNLCSVKGEPAVWNGTAVVTSQQPTMVATSRLNRLIEALRLVKPKVVAMGAVGLFISLCLFWWLGGLYERVFVVALGTSLVVVSVALWLALPVSGQSVGAGQRSPQMTQATWKAAYAFMRKWEGAKCVYDPVRTFKGITNGTYNAWRRDQGLGPGDVCRDLTEKQAEAIYYQRYWLASGADRLSPAVAIAHFDHAVNAGVGAAKGILAQCGDNANCYIKGRLADYRTKRNCAQYCRAWFNRVNDLVGYLRGKGS